MSWRQSLALGLRAAAGVLAPGPAAKPAAAARLPSTVGDLLKGGESLRALVAAVVGQSASISTLEDAVNAVQTALVDLGIEPAEIAVAIKAAEWLVPVLIGLLQKQWAPYGDPFAPAPNPPAGMDRSRIGIG